MEMNMKKKSEVLDGSDIMKLVGNDQVFSNFVDHKFQELDTDCDGKLSVKELQPAVADIGAALGLPSQGTSSDSDHIYSEVNFPFSFSYLNLVFMRFNSFRTAMLGDIIVKRFCNLIKKNGKTEYSLIFRFYLVLELFFLGSNNKCIITKKKKKTRKYYRLTLFVCRFKFRLGILHMGWS